MPFTNYTALTAYDLGINRPINLIVPNADVIANPNTPDYPFWFKFIAQAGDTTLPVWATTAVDSNYLTNIIVYTGPASAPVEYLFIESNLVPIQIPVTPGTEYFLQITQSNTPEIPDSDLTLSMLASPNVSSIAGDIIFTDFTAGFMPAIIAANGIGAYSTPVKQFIPTICSADFGDILPNGKMAFIDNATDFPHVRVYDTDYSELADVTGITSSDADNNRINSNGLDKFYVSSWDGVSETTVKRFNTAGTVDGDSWSFSNYAFSIAVSRDNLILYWTEDALNKGIHRHDLNTDTPLSDIISSIPNYFNGKDIFVMSDGTTLLIPYFHNVAGQPDFVSWYNRITGELIGTYTLAIGESLDRIALDKDDSSNFFYLNILGFGEGSTLNVIFRQISILTGLPVGDDIIVIQFNDGISFEDFSNDMMRVGISNSCPLVLIRSGDIPPVNNRSGIYKIVPDKRNDTLWLDVNSGTTEDVKIP